MHKIDLDSMNQKEQYKLLSASIVPRPIAWIVTITDELTLNLAPFSFFSIASNQIPLISISINRNNTKLKDSSKNIIKQKEAVIHIPSVEDLKSLNLSSASLASHESELELIDYKTIKSSSIKTPALVGPKIRMECTLYQHIEVKDEKDKLVSDLFLMRIKVMHINEEIYDKDKNYILQEKLEALSRLGGNYYSSSKTFYEAKRPD